MVIKDAVGEDESPVKHIYKGDIWVEFNPDSEAPEFVVMIEHLPKDALIDVSTADWKSGRGL